MKQSRFSGSRSVTRVSNFLPIDAHGCSDAPWLGSDWFPPVEPVRRPLDN